LLQAFPLRNFLFQVDLLGGEFDEVEELLRDAKKRRDDILAKREGKDGQQQ
jgi:hypothetical protein